MADNIVSRLWDSFEGLSTGGKIAVVAVGGGVAYLGYRVHKANANNPATGGGLGVSSGDMSGVPAQSDGSSPISGLGGLIGPTGPSTQPPQPIVTVNGSGVFGPNPPAPSPGNGGSGSSPLPPTPSVFSVGFAQAGKISQTGFTNRGSSGLRVHPPQATHISRRVRSVG